MLPMETYKIGGSVFEITDRHARDEISIAQEELDIAKQNIEDLITRTTGAEEDITRLKLSSITPDTSLGVEGAAADSKAVGDAIHAVENKIDQAIDNMTPEAIGAVSVTNIANNITTVEEGYVLDARQAYELNFLIQKRATTASYVATFPSSGWSAEAPYTQTVNVDGILLTDDPIVDIDMSSVTTSDDWALLTEAWNFVGRITANEGSVTMYCYEEKPTVDITIFLKVVR